jgi:CelD/BcsL family acetyltransferase involved in cellulose biosynthesis
VSDALHLEEADDLEAFRNEWDALALRSRSIFSTWEWLSLWCRHFATDRRLRIVGCRDSGGDLVAVLPLYQAGARPVRVLRFIGRGQGDELGPVCAPSERQSAARALRTTIAGNDSDLFLGEDLAGEFDWAGELGARVIEHTASPIVHFAEQEWAEFMQERSANTRGQLGRLERRVSEQGLRYRLATDPGRLDEDLDTLFALHTARWGRSPWFVPAEPFHRAFAALALERGWLRLWFMELNETPVAAWLGYRFAGVESYYQAGRDPAWDKASVGVVLLTHTIRAALEDRMDEYRFLRGSEGYKFRFANDDPGVVSVARATSALGHAGLAARTARRALRRAAGRLSPKFP